jgi:hypothetical protein
MGMFGDGKVLKRKKVKRIRRRKGETKEKVTILSQSNSAAATN